MRILTRHLIRAVLPPFFFALSALTGLLFLNAVARQMEDLAGKGLDAGVIVDFLVLSLPHTVALTLPMAVLVGVLHAFTEMTAANEITAMKAGGIPPQRILVPLLLLGVLFGSVMLFFNDRVLPEANHRLKNLMLDINRKTPTFVLREQVMNRIQSVETGETFFISAARIDNATSSLEEVAIFPATNLLQRRVTYADSGTMAFNPARTDLYLTLYDGVVFEADYNQPGAFTRTYYEKQVVPLRGIGNELERNMSASRRGDREMGLGLLSRAVDSLRLHADSLEETARDRSVYAVRAALGLPVEDSTLAVAAVEAARPRSQGRGVRNVMARDQLTWRTLQAVRMNSQQAGSARQKVARYQVEIHKKLSLAFACIVFVLLGVPLAIRFPRGGLGMVIAASSAIFAIYWMGLIGGEKLADRGLAAPWISQWIPNLIFTALALVLVRSMGRETATMRGGGWDDVWWTLRSWGARLAGRKRHRRRSEEPA
jgi:lipopolysaccharide export system permease protein